MKDYANRAMTADKPKGEVTAQPRPEKQKKRGENDNRNLKPVKTGIGYETR